MGIWEQEGNVENTSRLVSMYPLGAHLGISALMHCFGDPLISLEVATYILCLDGHRRFSFHDV